MTDSDNNKASPVTQLLVKKIHGKRKRESTFWKSEFDRTDSSAQQKNTPHFKLLLVFVLGCLLGGLILLFLYEGHTLTHYSREAFSTIKHLVHPEKNTARIEAVSTPLPEEQATQPTDYSVSEDQLQQAIKEVLQEKNNQSANDAEQSIGPSTGKYQYEIELITGGTIYTDNAEVTQKTVKYTSKQGLVISLNRDEILTMKKIRIE